MHPSMDYFNTSRMRINVAAELGEAIRNQHLGIVPEHLRELAGKSMAEMCREIADPFGVKRSDRRI